MWNHQKKLLAFIVLATEKEILNRKLLISWRNFVKNCSTKILTRISNGLGTHLFVKVP